MLTFATQTIANGTLTLTPEEPTSLQLALMGFAMLAIYAVFSGWRLQRKPAAVSFDAIGGPQYATEADEISTRRAA
jgi:hypothetical protein